MPPWYLGSRPGTSSNVLDVARQEACRDVQRRDAETLDQAAGLALPRAGRHADAAVKARAERAERLEADLQAGLGHAGAAGQRALGVLQAELDQVLVRWHAKRPAERAGEEAARQARGRGEIVERRTALYAGVEDVAGADQPTQGRSRRRHPRVIPDPQDTGARSDRRCASRTSSRRSSS